MRDNPEMKLCVEGHSDEGEEERGGGGGGEVGGRVSQERANNVQGYLLEQGIQPGRLRAEVTCATEDLAFGGSHSQPLCPEMRAYRHTPFKGHFCHVNFDPFFG